MWILYGVACVCLFSYFFYNSLVAIPFLMPIAFVLVWKQWEQWKKQVLMQIESGFKDWLSYLKGGLQSGKSAEYAILSSKEAFLNFIGEGHPILFGLEQLYRGLELHIPLEICLNRFGEETGVDAIADFAVVFEISKKQGGRMTATLEKTMQQIYDKIDLRMEISSLIAAKKLEQRIMCMMPFCIMFFIGKTSGGYFTPLYHNLKGILIMSVCLGLYLFCVFWGEKLTEVRV